MTTPGMTADDLNTQIDYANNSSVDYTIVLTSDIFEVFDPDISNAQAFTPIHLHSGVSLTIESASGGQYTIDGLGAHGGLVVQQGTVVLSNLTLANAVATGGDGSGGGSGGSGGGAAGLGGGLFVGAAANVTLVNVGFSNDKALGGNGGAGGPGNGAGGAGTTLGVRTLGMGGHGGVGGAAATAAKVGGPGGGGADGAWGGGGGGGGGGGAGAPSMWVSHAYKTWTYRSGQSYSTVKTRKTLVPAVSGGAGGARGAGGFGAGGGGQGDQGSSGGGGGGGGGGLGAGGDVFVQAGGSLVIEGGTLSGGSAQGGSGGSGASFYSTGSDGQGYGSGIFIEGSGVLTFAPELLVSSVVSDVIADQTGAGGTGSDAGAVSIMKTGYGALVLNAANTFTGGVTVAAGTLELGDSHAAGSGAIDLSGNWGPVVLQLDQAKSLANVIKDFAAGDAIRIKGFGLRDTLGVSGHTATLTSADGVSSESLVFSDATDMTGLALADTASVDQITICFMAGTMIAAPGGEVAIETLKRGDPVLTADGEVRPVTWIGHQTVASRFADPLRNWPIRIKAGALDENVPCRDLLVSPDHALLVGDVLVQAGALVNGTSIARETRVPEVYVYYHIELNDHALILAENTPAETFVDNADRRNFDNWAEHEALYPDGRPIAEMAFPRAKAQRQVPARIRLELAARAAVRREADAA